MKLGVQEKGGSVLPAVVGPFKTSALRARLHDADVTLVS